MRSLLLQRSAALSIALLYFFFVSGASAAALWERQDTPDSASEPPVSATEASASETTSPTAETDASSETSPSPTADVTSAASSSAPTATNNGTAPSNTTISTPENSSNTTASNSTVPCHIDATDIDTGSGLFCRPYNQSVLVNQTYRLVWDNSHYNKDAKTVTVEVKYLPNATRSSHTSENSDLPLAKKITVPFTTNEINLTFENDWLNGTNSTNLTLFIHEDIDGGHTYGGPMLTLLRSNSTENSTSSKPSSSSKTGEKVGIPIGTIFFIGVLLGLAFCFRRQILAKCSSLLGGKGAGGKGYTGNEARRSTGLGNDAFAVGHRRGDSFHDEPTTGGWELQDRGGGGEGNVFREEVDRQRGSRR